MSRAATPPGVAGRARRSMRPHDEAPHDEAPPDEVRHDEAPRDEIRHGTLRLGTALVVAALLGAALAGCGAQSGRADGDRAVTAVGEHLDEAASAVTTAQFALELVRDGRLPAVTADATVGRAVESVTAAAHDLAALVPPADAPAAVEGRLTAWHATAAGVAAVAQARVALGADDDAALRAAITVLDDAATTLQDAASNLPEPR